ncbi:signal peptidase II [Plebeiibacterium marinum]|uniref:Lipoprotein signal peptidase n=1 Tax=Plebeiibacterium marinum TaxID=2992111 RepID=A0AAE3MED3_9BACT|nr:signal peptidase II [Plebeiobacterium marinum]MCW3805906.1 signal peptidase II [Plebeiobacterium marinum]
MIAKTTNRIIVIFLLIIANVACDQITKEIVRDKVEYHKQTEVVGKYLILTKVENTGAFLGMGDSLPKPLYILLMILLPLIAIGYGVYYLVKHKEISLVVFVAICFIIGGGIGNIWDRILFGSVTDFLYFDFVIFHTGIVNMADISVTLGFFMILFEQVLNRKNTAKK